MVGEPPKYAKMKEMVLYKPLNKNFPAVDMMYKKDGLLYGLQVTTQKGLTKEITTSAVGKWLKAIEFEDSMVKVWIAVIPRPKYAEKFKGKFKGEGSEYPQLEVWRVPPKYDQHRKLN